MLRRRTWLAAMAAASFVAVAVAQGCGTSFPDSGFDNLTGDSGNGFDGTGPGNFGGGNSKDGQAPDDAPWDGAACETSSAQAFRLPIYMQMVLDGSGSMDGLQIANNKSFYRPQDRQVDHLNPKRPPTLRDNGSDPTCTDPPIVVCGAGYRAPDYDQWVGLTGKKWIAARDALDAFWDQLAKHSDSTFGVGFSLFSSTDPGDVPLTIVDAKQDTTLQKRVNPTGAGASRVYATGGTPLYDSINANGVYLQRFDPANPPTSLAASGKRVMVVITDGVPTPRGNNSQSDEDKACIKEVTDFHAGTPQITTFVIGVGDPTTSDKSDFDATFLGALAVAGGAAPAGCNANWDKGDTTTTPCHFQITPSDKDSAETLAAKFTAAITKIRDIIVPCDFALQLASGVDAGQVDPAKVNVVYTPGNGAPEEQLSNSATNGWTYNPYNVDAGELPTKVTLNGAACSNLKADAGGKIKIVLGCKTGEPVIRIY